ncbi:MAG: hypothetical protein K0Q55_1340 [Verrucomicrobia bacterium]|jgi:hypothetical protein|nr:hypothetical protein [Verrucomicrobiota bacterium]
MRGEITNIHVSVPQTLQIEALHEIALFGEITSVDAAPKSRTKIGASIPKQHVVDLKIWLQNQSNGQGILLEDEE